MTSSVHSELKAWEEKASKRKQVESTLLLSANQLREKGNELFRAGDFVGAEKFYSESLGQEETVEALANRALARLKLNRPEEAVDDCNKVLARDPTNVKGLARRATAKSNIGDHLGAFKDFSEAERLEPTNKVLKREREREEAFIQAIAAVNEESPEELDKSTPEDHTESSQQVSVSTKKPETDALLNRGVTGLNDKVVQEAINAVQGSVHLPEVAPQSAYVFGKIWRDLHVRPDLRKRLLLEVMNEKDFESCFSKSLDLDLLMDMLSDVDGTDLLQVLKSVSRLKSFSLIRMMLGTQKRAAIISRAGPVQDEVQKLLHA